MAQFAPTYMTVYDKDQGQVIVLTDLTIDEDETTEGGSPGSVIGAIGSSSTGGVLSLPYETGRNFGLDGLNLVVGPNGGNLDPGTYPVIVVENNPYAANSPKATTITITITAAGG